MKSEEQWRPVVGYEGIYEVSNYGRVKSRARLDIRGRRVRERILSQVTHPSGHKMVKLCDRGYQRTGKVHRLVLLAFIGPPPTGSEALHGDGDPANNNIENLSWGTRSENLLDRVRHGIHHQAVKTHCPQRHPYNDINTYVSSDGRRLCRECSRQRVRERRRRTRLELVTGKAS